MKSREPGGSANPRSSGGPRPWILGAALLAATLALFWVSRENPFFLDDYGRIVYNPEVREVLPMGRHLLDHTTIASEESLHTFRPLLPLTLSWNHAVHGLDVRGYRLVNHALVLCAAWLLFLLGRALARRRDLGDGGPVLAALLLAVHPVSTFTATYVCARDLLLLLVFLLATLLSHDRMRERSWKHPGHLVTLALALLASLSKENAVVLPLLVLLLEWLVHERPLLAPRAWAAAAWVALPVVAVRAWANLFLGLSLERAFLRGDPLEYARVQLGVHLEHYAVNFLWPTRLRFMPAVAEPGWASLRVLGGALLLGGLVALAWRSRRRHPVVAFGLLAYLCVLLPTSSVIPLLLKVTHYRPFPASPFLFLAIAFPVACWVRRGGPLRTTLVVGVLVALTAASVRVARIGRTTTSLWEHALRYGGDFLPYAALAREEQDLVLRRRLLEEAHARNPHSVQTLELLAGLELLEGRPREALALYERAGRASRGPLARHLLGEALCLDLLGRSAEAASLRREGRAALAPIDLLQVYSLAAEATRRGLYRLSIPLLRDVLHTEDAYREARYLLGFSLARTGRHREAVEWYRRAQAREPRPYVEENLAWSLRELGRGP